MSIIRYPAFFFIIMVQNISFVFYKYILSPTASHALDRVVEPLNWYVLIRKFKYLQYYLIVMVAIKVHSIHGCFAISTVHASINTNV